MACAHSGETGQAKQGCNKPHRHGKAGGGGCQVCSALGSDFRALLSTSYFIPQTGTQQNHMPAHQPWECSPRPTETLVRQTKLTGSFTSSSSLTPGLGRQVGSGAKLGPMMSWPTANHHLKKALPYLLHQLPSHHINSPSHAGGSRNISPADLLCKGSVADLQHFSSTAAYFCVMRWKCIH